MVPVQDKVTRFAADLFDSATVEGARQSRSGKQQLDHWARVGRAVSEGNTAARRRTESALAGTLALSQLTHEERVVFDGELDAAIQENLRDTHYGTSLASRGVTTVALDDDGNLVQYSPDGSTVVVESSS